MSLPHRDPPWVMTGRKQEDLSNSKTQLCSDIKIVLFSLIGLLPVRRILLYINPFNGHFDAIPT